MEREPGHRGTGQRGRLMVTLRHLLPASLEREDQADPEDREAQADRTDRRETEREILESPVRDQAVGRIVGPTEDPVAEDQDGHLALPEVRRRRSWGTKWTQ